MTVMGVGVYLLKRSGAVLEIGGLAKRVGTLRRFSKITEVNAWRADEMERVDAAVWNRRMPPAVLAWEAGMRLVDASRHQADGRVVLAWEPGRSYVADWNLDRLPVIGYALKNNLSGRYVLHEERGNFFIPMSLDTAKERGIIDNRDRLVRLMAPRIAQCLAVSANRNFRCAIADCVLTNGERCEILTAIEDGNAPPAGWYVGKRPGDVQNLSGAI